MHRWLLIGLVGLAACDGRFERSNSGAPERVAPGTPFTIWNWWGTCAHSGGRSCDGQQCDDPVDCQGYDIDHADYHCTGGDCALSAGGVACGTSIDGSTVYCEPMAEVLAEQEGELTIWVKLFHSGDQLDTGAVVDIVAPDALAIERCGLDYEPMWRSAATTQYGPYPTCLCRNPETGNLAVELRVVGSVGDLHVLTTPEAIGPGLRCITYPDEHCWVDLDDPAAPLEVTARWRALTATGMLDPTYRDDDEPTSYPPIAQTPERVADCYAP